MLKIKEKSDGFEFSMGGIGAFWTAELVDSTDSIVSFPRGEMANKTSSIH